MRSPSSFKLNLMVPCDAGCDGPICSSMISSAGSAVVSLFFQRAGSDMIFLARLARRAKWIRDRIDLGHDRLALVVRIILAQRMPFERIVQQDSAQVGMPLEC